MKSKWMFLLLVLLLAAVPAMSLAGDAPAPADVKGPSVVDGTVPAEAAAPGCPDAVDGKCCGACQQRARLTKKPAAEMPGCPCQRARQARESGEKPPGKP